MENRTAFDPTWDNTPNVSDLATFTEAWNRKDQDRLGRITEYVALVATIVPAVMGIAFAISVGGH